MTYKENITAILECYFTGFKEEIINSACNRILEQEPKTGRWIRQDNTKKPLYGWYFCSECNSVIGDKTEFCSNCGAKMESEDKR